jgi:tripartite-type tricarboxylate transporter receptor subunit TctC
MWGRILFDLIRRTSLLLVLAALCSLTAAPASAQWSPSKPVRVIVPFAPGGAPDVVGRLVGQQLSIQLGQPVVIDNCAGADGVVGAQLVAEAPPDGHTLLVTSSSFVINPSFHRRLPFDVVESFAPVTEICAVEAFILGVNPQLPVKSVPELVALAQRPEGITFSSPGVGNVLHLAAELFRMRTGTKLVHVPYKSGSQAVTALIAGEVDMAFLLPHSSMPFIQAGKIRALGYGGRARYPALPDVPTLKEAGVADVETLSTWTGLFAPAKTPPAVLARLDAEVKKAIAVPAVRERLVDLGFKPVGSSPAEFKPFVAAQVSRIADIVRAAGIEPQ